MKPFERAARSFGIEGAGWRLMRAKIVDKGGVGKTTVARTLIDYFGAHQTPTRAFDTESPRGTLKRFHPDMTEVVDVTRSPIR